MTTNQIIISILCAALVLLSLGLSMVIPRRDPGFPGRHLLPFALVVTLAIGGMLTAVELKGFEEEGEAAEIAEGQGGEGAGGEAPAEEAVAGDPAAGEPLFAANCGSCHVLAAAGTTGAVGPDLDASAPSLELVVDRVTNGAGAMPAFADRLSEVEIADVASYVVESTG